MERVIVVIEDEPELLHLVGAILQDEGYEVLCLSDPGLLARVLPGFAPRLFLLDLMLPLVSGIELARRLRADGHAGTPIVAMSASDLMLKAARASGLFNATVSKPFDLATLLNAVGANAA